ncbi:MAG: SCE4755 family polysaccharide monooxygenase-like protein [Polyangiaceae bacterium]
MRKLLLAVGVVFLVLPATAQAHFNLLAPPSSNTGNATEGGKGAPPCGPDSAASSSPTAVQGGQTLTLKINETVFHPGFYRVALALKSRADLPADPVVLGANMTVLPITGPGNSVSADSSATAFPVLANNLFASHTATGPQQADIKIPNINCDKCTLQVIEFMAQHGPNPGGGYFYHHCADLKITADPNQPLDNPGAGGGTSTGGTGAGGASGGSSGAAGAGGAATAGVGGTGAAGASAGAGGAAPGSAGAASAGAPASAGANSAGASSSTAGASSSTAGAASGAAANPGDDGGCSLSHRAAGSAPWLSLLLGLFALGRRRSRRG